MVPVGLPINPSLVPSGSSTWSDERALQQIKRRGFRTVTPYGLPASRRGGHWTLASQDAGGPVRSRRRRRVARRRRYSRQAGGVNAYRSLLEQAEQSQETLIYETAVSRPFIEWRLCETGWITTRGSF